MFQHKRNIFSILGVEQFSVSRHNILTCFRNVSRDYDPASYGKKEARLWMRACCVWCFVGHGVEGGCGAVPISNVKKEERKTTGVGKQEESLAD